MKTILPAVIALSLLAMTSCPMTGGRLQLGSERSFDGLIQVKTARSSAAWIHPDFDLSGYTKVKFQGAGIEYRPVRSNRARRAAGPEFPMSESAKERLSEILETSFKRELGKSERFELTEETGPDVLLVWAGLLDVVSFVPPERIDRGHIYLRSVGEATLVAELRDSQSNATLARILDRRAAERVSGGFESNTVNNTAEVKRLTDTWARLLRQRLDEAPTLSGGVVVD